MEQTKQKINGGERTQPEIAGDLTIINSLFSGGITATLDTASVPSGQKCAGVPVTPKAYLSATVNVIGDINNNNGDSNAIDNNNIMNKEKCVCIGSPTASDNDCMWCGLSRPSSIISGDLSLDGNNQNTSVETEAVNKDTGGESAISQRICGNIVQFTDPVMMPGQEQLVSPDGDDQSHGGGALSEKFIIAALTTEIQGLRAQLSSIISSHHAQLEAQQKQHELTLSLIRAAFPDIFNGGSNNDNHMDVDNVGNSIDNTIIASKRRRGSHDNGDSEDERQCA